MAEKTPLTEDQIAIWHVAMDAYCFNHDDSKVDVLFDLFDRDHNGNISRAELSVTLKSIYP